MMGRPMFLMYLLTALSVVSRRAVYTTTTEMATNQKSCWLTAPDTYRQQLTQALTDRFKLLEMTIFLHGHPSDMLDQVLTDVYRPYLWTRTTNKQGRSLLMLDDNYKYKSLSTLSIGVSSLEVNVTDRPTRCIRGMSEEHTMAVIRRSFLRDFLDPDASQGTSRGSYTEHDHICNKQITNKGDYVDFSYRCCQLMFDGQLSCHDLVKDSWVSLLLCLIIVTKVLVVLYSPLFLPEALYRLKYVPGQYIYHIPDPALTLKVAVTQDPEQFGSNQQHKTIRLSEVNNMEYFKTMVSSPAWVPDKVHEIKVKELRLTVKQRRLLDFTTVPVTISGLVYNNLIRCHLRRLEPLKDCCSADILSKFRLGFHCLPWYKCLKVLAQLCALVLLALPWILQIILYVKFEEKLFKDTEIAASARGLKTAINLENRLMPLNGLFIAVSVIFLIDIIIYCVASVGMKDNLKNIIKKCLRDMRERSRVEVLAWITRILVLPFRACGIAGFIIIVPYLMLVSLVAVPVIAFYLCPTLNLSMRLLINLFVFTCPKRLMEKLESWTKKFVFVKEALNFHELTEQKGFVRHHHHHSRKSAIQHWVIIIMSLLSLWSITLLLMEVISFYVEMAVYVFMGLVVNAGVTLQYITFLLLVVMYSKNTFTRVYSLYHTYHKVIHKQLLTMAKQEVADVASKESLEQENTAFIVQGDLPSPCSRPKIVIKKHKPQWTACRMLVFLDNLDTPLTPRKFFFETVDLKYFCCPGPIYRNIRSAIWAFLKIVIFLLFVFVVIMALGDAYQISTTNQVLATVVGGFLPFILSHIFKPSSQVEHIDTSSIQFKSEFYKAISNFKQSWPVFDIIPVTEVGNDLTEKKQASHVYVDSKCEDDEDEDCETDLADDDDEDDIDKAGDVGSLIPGTALVCNEQIEVDIIVDTSSSDTDKTDALQCKDLEKGSVTMLDRSPLDLETRRMYSNIETV